VYVKEVDVMQESAKLQKSERKLGALPGRLVLVDWRARIAPLVAERRRPVAVLWLQYQIHRSSTFGQITILVPIDILKMEISNKNGPAHRAQSKKGHMRPAQVKRDDDIMGVSYASFKLRKYFLTWC
jgi:hypothetical protein